MKKFNYSTVMMVALMLFLALTTGCSDPKNDEKQTLNDDSTTMVRTYVNHVDKGEYTAALEMVSGDHHNEYDLMPGIVEVGGTHGERIEIKNVNISCSPTQKAVVDRHTISMAECNFSCRVYIDGQLKYSVNSDNYKFGYYNEDGISELHYHYLGSVPIFEIIIQEKINRDLEKAMRDFSKR